MSAYSCYLQYLENYDNIYDDLPITFDMYKKCILESHDRVISYDSEKMLYRTYVDNKKMITCKTLEGLQDKLIEHYSQVGNGCVFLFQEVFLRACSYNLQYQFLSPSTIDRYLADASKYMFNSPYFQKDIREIIERDIVDFFCEIMKARPKAKMVRNLKTVIRFCFSYARMQEKIDCINISSCLREIHFPKNAYEPIILKDRVLLEEHVQLLTSVLTDSDVDFGLLFLFYTGLRVGEICALKVSDFNFSDKTVCIQRTESIRRVDKKRNCVDVLPKGNKIRTVYLSDDGIDVARFLCRGKTDFIFPKGNTHLHIDVFDHRLRRLCAKVKIPSFSVHDIRRTVATNWIDCDLPDDFVCSQLGHEDISITREYYWYSNKFKKQYSNFANSSNLITKKASC